MKPEVGQTFLTERQLDVLVMREEGKTQNEIAEEFGTSAANVSMIAKSARENVEKARRTVELAKYLRTGDSVEVERGDHIEDVVERVYDLGDVREVKVRHSKPELYSRVYAELSDRWEGERFQGEPIEIGLTEDGEVEFYGV